MHAIASIHNIMCLTDEAESVLHECVALERFLVNSENFKIRLNYEFIDDNGDNWKK